MQLQELYGVGADRSKFSARVKRLEELFIRAIGGRPQEWFSSSGRAEICGNHTDHNHGKVLVAAISCDILAAVKRRDDGVIRVFSEGFSPFVLDLSDLSVHPSEYGQSIALVRGIVKGIADRGYKVGGFDVCSESNIFRGAGVSSSAAFELLICEICNVLYLNGTLDPISKAIIAQYSENVYFGKPCGLLDQSGIALGGIHAIDFCTPSAPITERLIPPEGYSIVITNTGGSHAALTEHYAAIQSEMRAVAGYFGKSVLREVEQAAFWEAIPRLRQSLSERAILRAFHFYEENARVDAAAAALREKNVSAFLAAIAASGVSSQNCLQNCFVPGSAEQPVSLALHMSERIIRNGAARIHGGGFAGTVLAYLAEDEVSAYVAEMGAVFGKENVFTAQVRIPGAIRLDVGELIQ